ncbi:uncharacterized protein METZ01_LOCUS302160, partial [marine metagenome]
GFPEHFIHPTGQHFMDQAGWISKPEKLWWLTMVPVRFVVEI